VSATLSTTQQKKQFECRAQAGGIVVADQGYLREASWDAQGGFMEEADIKQQLHLLQKQVEAAVSLLEETKLNLWSQVDSLKIEVEILKRFITQHHSDFPRRYPPLKDTVTREIDPEWSEKASSRGVASEQSEIH
jgi:hypothetical protein